MQHVEFQGSIKLVGTKSRWSSFGLLGLNALNEGRRSDRTDKAREEVMMWGNVTMGRDIVMRDAETRSYFPG